MSDSSHGLLPAGDGSRGKGVRRDVLALGVALLLLLLAASVGGWYLTRLNSSLSNVTRAPDIMPSTRAPAALAEPAAGNQPVTFVLMGSDSRGTDRGRSDVLMVAYLSGDRQNAYLVSFPRDLWVTIPGRGEDKINAAYAYGGPALTIQTLESMLGTRMDHAALIDFEGFVRLTDVLGGVRVYNKHESNEGGNYFPEGMVTVQGEEALAFVRVRKSLPNGDFDRAERQRAVMTAIIDKVMSGGVVANPGRFSALVDKVAGSLTVDEELTNKEILRIGASVRFASSSAVRSLQAPVSGVGTSAGGASIDVVDEAGLKELATAMQTDSMEEYYLANR